MPSGKARHHTSVGKRPFVVGQSRYTQLQERRAEVQRTIKRQMKEQGIIEDKIPPAWEWRCGEDFGVVVGFTKGEARSKVKKKLGTPKKRSLPSGVQIRKVEYNEPTS